ncbi:enoyl-CoA hydratase [Rhodopseudomonas palustris]|uniref:enoyl-CoA hydratase n=1 Tax=Rhodopseudomonas palustris TaxID=1076 RepID=UPI002ACD93DF|nr:enoyl-CoA hydratase [Rhodopseudomonas palustris]WQH01424.1 enoyl-CoA hydratase [Rhodopseudomonas palustris]
MRMINSHCGVVVDDRGVVRLTICAAGPLNILNSQVIDAVREGVAQLAADASNRVLIICGESDRSMIGGADIKEMATLDQASAERFITGLGHLCETIRTVPYPVIARIPGWCLGGGLEVAAACDFRVAAENAKFAMPEVRVGIPSVIHAALLPRLIGWSRTRWLLMTAETIDAPTALGWGLIDTIAPPDVLDDAVEGLVASLLAAAPQALRAQKALLTAWHDMPLREAVDHSVTVFGQAYLTGEPQRLMGEFISRKR